MALFEGIKGGIFWFITIFGDCRLLSTGFIFSIDAILILLSEPIFFMLLGTPLYEF